MNFSLSRNINKTQIKILTEKYLKIAYLILGVVTLLWTLSFIIYHFYASSVFGFNPTYNNPTYTEFSNNNLILELNRFLTLFWIVSIWCSLYIFPIVFAINLLMKFTNKVKLNFKIILFSFFSCLSNWLILYLPSFGDTFGWMLD